jgi:hypothetical protein
VVYETVKECHERSKDEAKKHSLYAIKAHFEPFFNEVFASAVILSQSLL